MTNNNSDKTQVWFKVFNGEILAIFKDFLEIDYRGLEVYLSYAHIGQHGDCNKGLKYLKNATPDQYEDLLNELTAIGYNIEVIPKIKFKKSHNYLIGK